MYNMYYMYIQFIFHNILLIYKYPNIFGQHAAHHFFHANNFYSEKKD